MRIAMAAWKQTKHTILAVLMVQGAMLNIWLEHGVLQGKDTHPIFALAFPLLVFVALFLRKLTWWPSMPQAALGLGLSCAHTIGICMHYFDSFGVLRPSFRLVAIAMSTAGNGISMAILIALAVNWLEQEQKLSGAGWPKGKAAGFLDRHFYPCAAGVMLLGWLPWLIVYYPGSINWDMTRQLGEILGLADLTTHHPVVSSAIMGLCMKIGHGLIDYNFGAFLYILLQSVACALAYSLLILWMKRIGCGWGTLLSSVFFFSLLPLWGGTAQFGDKDPLYSAVFVVYALYAFLFAFGYRKLYHLPSLLAFTLSALMSSLLRNNAIYIVVVTALVLLFCLEKKDKRLLAASTAGTLAVFLAINAALLSALGVRGGSKAEALSVFFQQSGRVIMYHGDELPDGEREILGSVLDFEAVAANYVPAISDPVKDTYRLNGAEDELAQLGRYFGVWAKQLFRYPRTYIEAFVGGTYGYYSFTPPIESNYAAPSERFYNRISGRPVFLEEFQFHFIFPESMRNFLLKWSDKFQGGILGFFYSLAFYTWMVVIAAYYMGRKRTLKKIGGLMPIILTIAVCCISPANDLFRYFIPVSAFSPMLLAIGRTCATTADKVPPESRKKADEGINYRGKRATGK